MGEVLRVLKSEPVKRIRGQVEQFAKDIMEEYLEQCEAECNSIRLSCKNTKNFYDSVWGTIEINQGEIFILDSPLLQRLRYIKQLGMADLLYSSANHTRYSHTLGVLQTADVMAERIQRELQKKNISQNESVRTIIRLAAIFHDCGHMFCSHASERYFQKERNASLYNEVSQVRDYINLQLRIKPSLSELLSVLLVNSPSVRKLLKIVERGLENIDFGCGQIDENIERICCMIWGIPYSEKEIPYSQVISGQIDADKLDYLKRDSHSTGVPVAVDMSRVFQKLRVVSANKKYNMVSSHVDMHEQVFKMGIAPAAINTIDQLVMSRYMMYENVYFHQKTLTAEEMLRYAMRKLDEGTQGVLDNFSKILCLTDSMFICQNIDEVLPGVIGKPVVKDRNSYKKAAAILESLYKRQLFKRCVAFTDKNLTKAIQTESDFYNDIITDGIIARQNEFIERIVEKVKELKQLLDGEEFHFNKETDILLIMTPDTSSASYSNVAIDSRSKKDRDMEFEADNWLKSRASRKPQNYLVSYPEDRYLIYVATEIVLYKDYGVLMNDTVIYTEEDERHIDKLKKKLDDYNLYSSLYALAPDSDIQRYENVIVNLVEKWKAYEIFDVSNGTGISITYDYLVSHLKQYIQFKEELGNYNIFLQGYLKMLSEVQIISKEKIATALADNLNKILEKEGCEKEMLEICNIGNLQDGSAILTYHMNMVNHCIGQTWKAKSIDEVLDKATEGQRIVFLEDAFCSGKQIVSIFETYMGIPMEKRQTKEQHVKELSPEKQDLLKSCKLFFSFIYYEKSNESFFKESLRRLGLKNVEIIARQPFPEGYFKREIVEEERAEREIVKSYLEKAGEMLIEWKAHRQDGSQKPNWDSDRMTQSRLGYNDAQQLIAFSWNTPTYTMTPLWMAVDSSENKWMPLFPRIDK